MSNLAVIKKKLRKNTRLVWIESCTNPTLKCSDIAGIAKLCKANGTILGIDNTFMSPTLVNPCKLGADITMHSVTKYINGHADVLAGAVCLNDDKLYEQIYQNLRNMGNCISPFDAYLALRGCKTMELRVMKACENAMTIAKWLDNHPKIEKVLYPGL